MTPARDTATYLYAVVRSDAPPALRKAPAGLPGVGPVRAIDAGGGLWLIASDAPLEDYGEVPIARGLRHLDWVSERALAHERVVEHCARSATTVPMKLFTLFSSDERAAADIRRRRRVLDGVLARLSGREEYGVRVRLAPRSARRRMPTAARNGGRAGNVGMRFLKFKQAARDAERRAAARARRGAAAVYRALGRQAVGSRRLAIVTVQGGSPLLLDAAFLVDRDRASRFRRAVRAIGARAARAGCQVSLTGPWPPYNFVARG